jgi:hypothetical protein
LKYGKECADMLFYEKKMLDEAGIIEQKSTLPKISYLA